VPEDELETSEIKERIEESLERLEENGPEGPGWLARLSLSTAIIAVFAAVASLQSGGYSNEAILAKSEAVLAQSKAADQWAYYQAKGVKGAIAASQAEVLAASNAALADKLRADAGRYRTQQDEIEAEAHRLERKVEESNRRSQELMERHHHLALAVTLFQIAIALSAIAALTRRRLLWLAGLAASTVALAVMVYAGIAAS
jgi:uncharacterized protein DUF4337